MAKRKGAGRPLLSAECVLNPLLATEPPPLSRLELRWLCANMFNYLLNVCRAYQREWLKASAVSH